MLALGAAGIKEVVVKSRLESDDAQSALNELMENGQILLLEKGEAKIASDMLIISLPHWNSLSEKVLQTVDAYHKQFPLRRGIPREELKSKLKLAPRFFNLLIANYQLKNVLTESPKWVSLPDHKIQFAPADQKRVDELLRAFEKNPYATPSVKECQSQVGEEVLAALVQLGELTQVSPEVIFRKQDYDGMVEKIRAAINQNGQVTLGEVRDLFGTTRKYIQALLEHLDSVGVTMRAGDARKLK